MVTTCDNTTTKRIFIVDDHPIVRAGLVAQLSGHPQLQICGTAEDVADAVTRIPDAQPDVIIVDVVLKSGSGIDLIRRLRAKDEACRILVWSMYSEHVYAERAFHAGANGYVDKTKSPEQIIDAINTVLTGKIYMSDSLREKLLGNTISVNGKKVQSFDRLADREMEAFELIGQGWTTQEIAKRMHVSPKTVDTYRARIKEKLGLRNGTELIHSAVQWVLGKPTLPIGETTDGHSP
jgi:DNA-binding NarL/FixJ family response regulator